MIKPTLNELEDSLFEMINAEAELNSHKDVRFPLAVEIGLQGTDFFQFITELVKEETHYLIFESGRAGRYTFVGYQPQHAFVGKGQQLQLHTFSQDKQVKEATIFEGKLLDQLEKWMSQTTALNISGLPDFRGGLAGYFSYDLVREIELLPKLAEDDLALPEVYLLAFDQLLVYDQQLKEVYAISYNQLSPEALHDTAMLQQSYNQAVKRLEGWQQELERVLHTVSVQKSSIAATSLEQDKHDIFYEELTGKERSFAEEDFVNAVKHVQEYIAAGDVFQINLSVRQARALRVHPFEIYKRLRELNPSPYMGYIHLPEFQIVSGSPEQLVKLDGKKVDTRPIAGTRPRGKTREEDLQLANELIQNEKERAEHVMLVDLERNDLGKVCRFGTVEVNEFMVIEEYSHVMHIVSNVRGELAPNKNAFDVIRATFPGGTITGAPKVRTMEIIEELEPVRRGLYTGSIGWLDYNGNMELNIVIRTLLAKDQKAYVQAGAGIVIDSVPANEYIESLNKAKALWVAYELAHQQGTSISNV